MTYLFGPRNIDPAQCFRTVRTSNHEGNLLGVANGVLDAATNNTTNIKRLARSNAAMAARVKVIWTSPRIPEDPIVWRKDLDPAVKERVRQFFLTYGTGQGADAERQRKILADLDFGVFQPADDSHLLPVREMQATEAVIQARNAGDQAKLAEAQRELDKVRAERVEHEARAGAVPAS
jgi:phosphonate transport system substrate-binding protein